MHQIGIYPAIELITAFVLLWLSIVSICTYLKWNAINWLNGEDINFFFLLKCDDSRQFDFQTFRPQIFLASLMPWNPYFLRVTPSMVTSVEKKKVFFNHVLFAPLIMLLYLPGCLWAVWSQCRMSWLKIDIPQFRIPTETPQKTEALLSHSSPPAEEQNWRHKKVKITGWDKDNFLEIAMK